MPEARRILVILAHPALQRSRVNRVLLDAIRDLPGVTLHDLYEAHPEGDLDVRSEQALLLAHDVVVFQHPFYWYSTPSLLKEWQDLVLEHGWAYGRSGRALEGKVLLSAITAGGGETAYRRDGYNRFTIRELLAPIEATANLCRMVFLAPFVVHGTHVLDAAGVGLAAAGYRRVLEALRDGRLDLEAARRLARLDPATLPLAPVEV